jgi:hypothetical protein
MAAFALARHFKDRGPKLYWFETVRDRSNYIIIHLLSVYRRQETEYLEKTKIGQLFNDIDEAALIRCGLNPSSFFSEMKAIGNEGYLTDEMIEKLEVIINENAHIHTDQFMVNLVPTGRICDPDGNQFTSFDLETDKPFVVLRYVPEEMNFRVGYYRTPHERDAVVKPGDILHDFLPNVTD